MDGLGEFIQAGIQRVYPGQWTTISGGFGTAIEAGDQGILVIHPDDAPVIHFAGGVLSGMKYSDDLVKDVFNLNRQIAFGALTLSEGQPGHWMLCYGYKMVRKWLDPSSRSAAQLVLDLLNFVPEYAGDRVQELQPKYGGDVWGVGESWWYVLMDKY